MANVINLSSGSSGSEVKKLQQALIEKGYDVGSTGADGVFGKNTLAAVKQYQKDNGLEVDGIAGKLTQGSLYGTGSTKVEPKVETKIEPKVETKVEPKAENNNAAKPEAPAEPTTSPAGFTYGDFQYDPYDATADPVVSQAHTLLQNHMSGQPGEYKPVWLDEAESYLSQYQNRDPFSYDFNSDALYNQYKDQYIQQGRMAMMVAPMRRLSVSRRTISSLTSSTRLCLSCMVWLMTATTKRVKTYSICTNCTWAVRQTSTASIRIR